MHAITQAYVRVLFEADIERMRDTRIQLAAHVAALAASLDAGDSNNFSMSGGLGLASRIARLDSMAAHLNSTPFRIMVTGAFDRGKSSLLNVILGENLLPIRYTKATALLTVLRYGSLPRVTIYHSPSSHLAPQDMSISDFRRIFTSTTNASPPFSQVSHAVIEYPSELLNGIEIVDNPGLTDTIEHTFLSLALAAQCDAILFVADARFQLSTIEHCYLADYLTLYRPLLFFILNRWDLLADRSSDEQDSSARLLAEDAALQMYRTSLTAFFDDPNFDDPNDPTFESRVFPLSTRDALRRIAQDANAPLNGTGYSDLLPALAGFLHSRSSHVIHTAKAVATEACDFVHNRVHIRESLLTGGATHSLKGHDGTVTEESPDITQLATIRASLEQLLYNERTRVVNDLAISIHKHMLSLGDTFDTTFPHYEPAPGLLALWRTGKVTDFHLACKETYERYLGAAFATWITRAAESLNSTFATLGRDALTYGRHLAALIYDNEPDQYQRDDELWHFWHSAALSAALGNSYGAKTPGHRLLYRDATHSTHTLLNIQGFLFGALGSYLGPDSIRHVDSITEDIKAQRSSGRIDALLGDVFREHLPDIAERSRTSVTDLLGVLFDAYAAFFTSRIDDELTDRRLVHASTNITYADDAYRVAEVNRLRLFDRDTTILVEQIGFAKPVQSS